MGKGIGIEGNLVPLVWGLVRAVAHPSQYRAALGAASHGGIPQHWFAMQRCFSPASQAARGLRVCGAEICLQRGTKREETTTSPLHPKAASSCSADVQQRKRKEIGVLKCGSQRRRGLCCTHGRSKPFALYCQELVLSLQTQPERGSFLSGKEAWEVQTGCGCKDEQNK